jgi:hypothetical protein
MMRTPTDPESEIKRTLYGMDGIAPGFLRERRAWEDRFPSEEDEIGSSGSKDGTWKTVDDDSPLASACGERVSVRSSHKFLAWSMLLPLTPTLSPRAVGAR